MQLYNSWIHHVEPELTTEPPISWQHTTTTNSDMRLCLTVWLSRLRSLSSSACCCCCFACAIACWLRLTPTPKPASSAPIFRRRHFVLDAAAIPTAIRQRQLNQNGDTFLFDSLLLPTNVMQYCNNCGAN